MSDNTDYLHARMNTFDDRQRQIIQSQARCEEQTKNLYHDMKEVKAGLATLLEQAQQRKGSITTLGVILGGGAGILGAFADWIAHHLHWFN